MAEVVVTRLDQDVTQAFTAEDAISMTSVPATWSLDRTDLGEIDQSGVFKTRSAAGGEVKVKAEYNGLSGEATLRVRVELVTNGQADGGAQVPPSVVTILNGGGTGTNGPDILYPYQNTVFPRGILSPLIQYATGTNTPVATKVSIKAPNFSWTGLLPVSNPQRPNATIPEDLWDAALRSASGTHFDVEVTYATATAAFGPSKLVLNSAPGSLKGSVYYMTYDGANLGVWRVRTGTKAPPEHVVKDCTVCHSVSANGQRLVTGGENNAGGVLTLRPDGSTARVSGAPGGLGGDSRGLSFATLTPDGKYVLRSQSNFWGGINQKAFRINDMGSRLDEANVVGMGAMVSAFVPTVSPDGRFFAFTQGQMSPSPMNAARALKVMDLTVDDNAGPAGTLTFSNERTIVDNGPTGRVVKFVTFLPNTKVLVFQESERTCGGYGMMMPTLDQSCALHSRGQSRLMHVDTSTATPTVRAMVRANQGLMGEAEWQNYEPFALPSVSGGFYWVAFTSTRVYGNVYKAGENRKQLWVAAVNPNPAPGADPSYPAFYLPNQLPTENERGYWALDPCLPTGSGCSSGDACCEGFCRAPTPGAPRVCSPKPQGCAQSMERCRVDSDCCPVFEGPPMQCLAGFCTSPSTDGGIPEIQ
jgi:hypothetical protein